MPVIIRSSSESGGELGPVVVVSTLVAVAIVGLLIIAVCYASFFLRSLKYRKDDLVGWIKHYREDSSMLPLGRLVFWIPLVLLGILLIAFGIVACILTNYNNMI